MGGLLGWSLFWTGGCIGRGSIESYSRTSRHTASILSGRLDVKVQRRRQDEARSADQDRNGPSTLCLTSCSDYCLGQRQRLLHLVILDQIKSDPASKLMEYQFEILEP